MNRTDYLALFDRIARNGIDSRLHWASGPRAGHLAPWDGDADKLPGRPVRGHGTQCRDVDGDLAYAETLMGEARVVIAGAGHVGAAFASLAVMLGFHVTVIDERPEFGQATRLPGVAEVICGPYAETLESLPDYANCYYVLVTPGHAQDRESALACLAKPYEYLGMIGSRGKVATVTQALRDAGITDEQLATLHAPIGLPIGGREPAEIAVSIAAEIISVRSAHDRRSFDPRVATAIAALGDREAVLATIIGHGGSVPRGAGSRMLVTDGDIVGSVGGGAVEAAAIAHARQLEGSVEVADYSLSNSEGASLGMICGGHVKVMFERL